MTQKRVLRVLSILLVLVLFVIGVWYIRRTEQKDKNRIDDLYAMVEPLQQQREELVRERDGIDAQYAQQMRDGSTVEILFRELDAQIFTDIYPVMRENGIIGILGISPIQSPGGEGQLSLDEYNRLMMDGWGTCLIYEQPESQPQQQQEEEEQGEAEEEETEQTLPQPQQTGTLTFDQWYALVQQDLLSKGCQMPTAIYFSDGDYDSSLDAQLLNNGIETVIVSMENGLSQAVEEVGSGIWHTAVMPWNYTGIMNDIDALTKMNGGNLSFTVSFSDMWDAYEENSFARLMNNLSGRLTVGEPEAKEGSTGALMPMLTATDYASARQMHASKQSTIGQLQDELLNRKSELDEQIAQLDEQIRKIYDQWNDI